MILSRFPHMEIQNHNHRQKNEFIPIFQFPVFLRLHTDWKSDKSNSCAFPISVFETGCDDAGGGAFESICTKLTPRPVVGKERRAVLLLQHSTTITITKQQHPAPVAHQSGLRAVLTISGNCLGLPIKIYRVIWNFSLHLCQKTLPPSLARLDCTLY